MRLLCLKRNLPVWYPGLITYRVIKIHSADVPEIGLALDIHSNIHCILCSVDLVLIAL